MEWQRVGVRSVGMRWIGAFAVLIASSASADPFVWNPDVETRNEVTEGDVTVWRRWQSSVSAYEDVEIWIERSGLHQTIWFGKCAGGMEVKIDGDDVVLAEQCGKYDEDITWTRWRWNGEKHRYDKVAARTENLYQKRARPVRALLTDGKFEAALAKLEEIEVYEAGGHADHSVAWATAFLKEAIARKNAKALRSIVTSRVLLAGIEGIESAYLLNEAAFVLYEGGENDLAIALLRRVLELDPDRAVARLNLADALWKRGGEWRDEARSHYQAYRLRKKKVPKRVEERLE